VARAHTVDDRVSIVRLVDATAAHAELIASLAGPTPR
jgi:hypothetical protein